MSQVNKQIIDYLSGLELACNSSYCIKMDTIDRQMEYCDTDTKLV